VSKGDVVKQIEAIIYIEPTAKGRPKATSFGGHARLYTPAKTRKAEQNILALIRTELKNKFQSFDKGIPLHLTATFFLAKPASSPKKITHPVKRPDLDNYVKTLLDALNGYIFPDDSQIVSMILRKSFGTPPRIELMIREEVE